MSGAKNRQPHQGLSVITKHIKMEHKTIHRIRLSKMQKLVNVLAVASAAVSLAVVGAAGYVFVNKDAIIQGVVDNALGDLGGLVGGGGADLGGSLPTGANDLSPTTNPEVAPQASAGVPLSLIHI